MYNDGLTLFSKYSFVYTQCDISLWNGLPESVVCAPSLSIFKQFLHHFLILLVSCSLL